MTSPSIFDKTAGRHWLFMVIKNSKHLVYMTLTLTYSMSRRERDWVLGEFKNGRSPILIATDVASRGLGMYFIISAGMTRLQR